MLAKLMSLFLLGLVRVLTGAQARWYGCPPKAEQRIYFANHQSHADLVMIWAALPKELRSITRPIGNLRAAVRRAAASGGLDGAVPVTGPGHQRKPSYPPRPMSGSGDITKTNEVWTYAMPRETCATTAVRR